MAKQRYVVVLSLWDFGGSGFKLAEAVRKTTDYHVTHIRFYQSTYNFPYDACVMDSATRPGTLRRIQHTINGADIVHIKGDFPVLDNKWGVRFPVYDSDKFPHGKPERANPPPIELCFTIPRGIPKVQTISGSLFRRSLPEYADRYPKRRSEFEKKEDRLRLRRIKETTDARTAMTPDINTPSLDGTFIPQAIDSNSVANTWVNSDPFVIGHSPSSKTAKGTESILEPALNLVEGFGYKFSTKIITGQSHSTCVMRKQSCTAFWDQCRLAGFYGNSALEAAQFGIPVMVHVDSLALDRSENKLRGIPYIVFDNSIESCAEAFIKLLNMSPPVRQALAEETKAWTNRVHSYEAVGPQYAEIYDRLLKCKR